MDGRDAARHGGFRGFAEARVISLWPALNGIDQRGARGAKIEGCECAAIRGFEQGLVFGGGEEVLLSAVRIVVQQFDARHEGGGGLPVSNGFRSEERRVGKECRSR